MRCGLVTIAYNEERFLPKFLSHIPEWVDEKLVLLSAKPWNGPTEELDNSYQLADSAGAKVILHDWRNEQDQRNTGQEYFHDMDWIIVLDPDEFLSKANWDMLKAHMEGDMLEKAFVCDSQSTYWKDGWVVTPPEEYRQIILTRPEVRFVDKRVVNTGWGYAPVHLHHFSWARTNEEVWSKISHYGHAQEFDTEKWYKEVWLAGKTSNLHPLTPHALEGLARAQLPPEIERLDPWPRLRTT